MKELSDLKEYYENKHTLVSIDSVGDLNDYALGFYIEVASIYNAIIFRRNVHRNPSGFSLNDAPVLGLLTRIWKLLQLSLRFYRDQNADFKAIFGRPLLEASLVATYLLTNGDEAIEDFRKCSYKDTLRILRDHRKGSDFFKTNRGRRVLELALKKLAIEDFDQDSFRDQRKRGWQLQGKSMRKIFHETIGTHHYPSMYGMLSESIHGSWNNSMDWCLTQNADQTYSTNPHFIKPDIRTVTPWIDWSTPPFGLWLSRIEIDDQDLIGKLDWIIDFNNRLYRRFDYLYDG